MQEFTTSFGSDVRETDMANLYFVTNDESQRNLRNAARRGELFPVRKGIYIDTDDDALTEQTIINQWHRIAQFLFDGSIAAFRTADELRPINGRVYLITEGLKRRTVVVGPVEFIVDTGDTGIGVEPFQPEMMRSNTARLLLENCSLSRARSKVKKTLGKEWVEKQLIKEIEIRGEEGINQIRDEAREIAESLAYNNEFEVLNKMISALQNTHPVKAVLQTRSGIAHAAGGPYDEECINRFEAFSEYLSQLDVSEAEYKLEKASWRNLTFFESYFSNYIEGTRFTLDEAEEIVFSGKEDYERHEDCHDILSHVALSGDHAEMCYTPDSPEALIKTLKNRHELLLAQRPDKKPGIFKEKANKAGSTHFVQPDKVEGTLVQGFDLYQVVPDGLKRALFIHFMIAECHPFDDGNGRLSRIMMNAELVANDLHKIIVPTVARENYLNGMRLATRQNTFRNMVKIIHQLHQYTALINWSDYGDARDHLEKDAADKIPDEGLHIFNKRISQFRDEYPVDTIKKRK